MNSRLRPNQLQPGDVALSENGRMETNQMWKPREGYKSVSGTLTQSGVQLVLSASGPDIFCPYLIRTWTVTGISRVEELVTFTTSADHGYPVGTPVIDNWEVRDISPPFDLIPELGGNKVITATSTTEFTFSAPGEVGSESYSFASASPVGVELGSNPVIECYGSCKYSNPNASGADYIVIATTSNAQVFDLSSDDVPGSVVTVSYPGSDTISNPVNMIQAFDKVFIFREGDTSLVWDGDLSGGLAFSEVPSGTKTQHSMFQATGNTTIADGVATVTASSHGLSAGDEVTTVNSSVSGIYEGRVIKVATVPTSGTFTFYTDGADVTSGDVVYSTSASALGGGYINMPGTPWAIQHQRRLWMPYSYNSDSPPVSRGVLDEVIATDILDHTTCDPIGSQFRITAGTADFLVGLYPFTEDYLIAFNRNSIHVLKGVSGSLSDVEVDEVTSEIGCVARKSIAAYANQVMFLSDNGVYAFEFVDEYNLRGAEMPLSEAIQPIIDRITPSHIDKAIGRYHDNRYWLAVPLDGKTYNNAVLVYNFLNRGWESLDYTAAATFSVLDFHEARSGKRNELYAVTQEGALVQMTETGRGVDSLPNFSGASGLTDFKIPDKLVTRSYTMGSMERKKWSRIEAHILSDDKEASDGRLTAIIEDPDSQVDLGVLSDHFSGVEIPTGEGATIRARIGNPRGYALQYQFESTHGRPAIRAIKASGTATLRSTTSAQ